MYNLTVDEAHPFFVGDGAWLVHNCGDWIDDLIDGRSIDKPQDQTLDTQTLQLIKERLKAKGIETDGTNIAILEVNGRWYLGFSRKLDQVVTGGLGRSTSTQPKLKANNQHAEPNTIQEYFNYIMNGGQSTGLFGKMVVTSQPCSSCVKQPIAPPYPGAISDTMNAANLTEVEVVFGNSAAPRWKIIR
jgi:hypothetical protein